MPPVSKPPSQLPPPQPYQSGDLFALSQLRGGVWQSVGASLGSVGTVRVGITTTAFQLFAGGYFFAKTGIGLFLTPTLPQLASVAAFDALVVADIDNNAGFAPVTVMAFPGDQISDHGTLVPSWALNVSNTAALFSRNSSSWTVMGFGF